MLQVQERKSKHRMRQEGKILFMASLPLLLMHDKGEVCVKSTLFLGPVEDGDSVVGFD